MLEFIKMINYKKLVDSLSDENITKKAYDKALSQISDRVNEIWRYICKVSKRKLEWYAFSNDVEYGDGDGSSG
jgi:3-methyladenine DNA glycosylase AlkD